MHPRCEGGGLKSGVLGLMRQVVVRTPGCGVKEDWGLQPRPRGNKIESEYYSQF